MDLTRIIQGTLRGARQSPAGDFDPGAVPTEQNHRTVQAHRKRGRKSMSAEERKVVAERMKTYWASKRQQNEKPREDS